VCANAHPEADGTRSSAPARLLPCCVGDRPHARLQSYSYREVLLRRVFLNGNPVLASLRQRKCWQNRVMARRALLLSEPDIGRALYCDDRLVQSGSRLCYSAASSRPADTIIVRTAEFKRTLPICHLHGSDLWQRKYTPQHCILERSLRRKVCRQSVLHQYG
jgi:hypothetical protein